MINCGGFKLVKNLSFFYINYFNKTKIDSAKQIKAEKGGTKEYSAYKDSKTYKTNNNKNKLNIYNNV